MRQGALRIELGCAGQLVATQDHSADVKKQENPAYFLTSSGIECNHDSIEECNIEVIREIKDSLSRWLDIPRQ